MGAVIIHLRPPLLAAFRWALRPSRATYPEARAGSPQLLPQTPAGVLLVLLQVGFAVPRLSPIARWSLTPPFHPYPDRDPRGERYPGGLFSVALSRGSPRVGVTHHLALWSPDFPQLAPRSPSRLVQSTILCRVHPNRVPAVQFGVASTESQQLGRSATLDNAAMVEHHNLVGITNRAEPVRDGQRGAAGSEVVERRLQLVLGIGVQRAGRLVQDQHARVA